MNTNTGKWLRTRAASVAGAFHVTTTVSSTLAAVGIGLLLITAGKAYADQETVYDGCMQDLAGYSLNCTANDVSLSEVMPGDIMILDPCDYPGDSTTFRAKFTTVLTAQARYDVGIFFDVSGDSQKDGALTGSCSVSSLAHTPDPPWLDLDGTKNLFVGVKKGESGIQDTCGDIDATHNPLSPEIEITALCVDTDDPPDGKLNLPYCTSWRQPGSNELCTGPLPEQFLGGWSSGVIPGAPSKCKCDLGFNVPVPVPAATLEVTKGASPSTVSEPGASVLFTVTVKNTAIDPNNAVELQSLEDDIYDDITSTGHDGITSTTCNSMSNPFGSIQPNATYSCTFTALVEGDGGDWETDTVVATGLDANGETVSGQDDATVTITDAMPAIQVVKIANPTSVNEPGGDVTFTVTITNKSASSDPVTLTSLLDSIYGPLNGNLDCKVGTTLVSGASCSFEFTAFVDGNAGYSETDTVTVAGKDDEGNQVSDEESATVDIQNVGSSIDLNKTADPTSIDEPGDDVLFTFTVTNTSAADGVTISSLTDSIYGDLNGKGSCSVPQTLTVGASYNCSATFYVEGEPGSVLNIATASGKDDDGKDVSNTDDETVQIENVPPKATLTKNVTILCATYEVQVTNDSAAEALSLDVLVDDLYGDLLDQGNEAIEGTTCVANTIPVGGSYTCSFEACTATSPTTDTVTGTVSDNDGGSVQRYDSATVTFGKPAP
jgi:hypothetical protein